MATEPHKQKIKRFYEANQNGLDKALLSVILALPPVLIFLYDKFDKTNSMACQLYLWAIGISLFTLTLFLLGFVFAKHGCDSDDFAHSTKCKNKRVHQRIANFCYNLADFFEKIYLLGVISVLCLLFALFYFSLKPRQPKELSFNCNQLAIPDKTPTNIKHSIKNNDVKRRKVMSENHKPIISQNSMTPPRLERKTLNNSLTPPKSEREPVVQKPSSKSPQGGKKDNK